MISSETYLSSSPQDIKIEGGRVQQLTFWNAKAGTLVIQKKDSVTGALISGAQFQLTYANGGYVDNDNGHLSSNGLYTTDDKGEIRIYGITGTVVVKETKPAPGYVIDQSTQTQTVTVNPLDTQTLTFLNEPLCSLTLTKRDSVTGKPVPGTEFTVKDGNGTVLGRYTTGKDGTVVVTGLIPGSTVVVTETKVPSGYVLNSTPQTIIVKNGSTTVNSGTVGGTTNVNPDGNPSIGGGNNGGNDLAFENDPKTRLIIEKYVTGTTTPLKGVTFLITESNGQVLGSANGEYVTDENGRIVIEGLEPGVTIVAKEIRSLDGYVLDTTPKTIQIKVGDAQTLKFYNSPVGGLELIKVSENDKTKRLANVTFEIRKMDGGLVDTVTTDSNGRVHVSLEAGNYYAVEIETAKGFKVDATPHYFTIRDNETTTLTVTNKAFSGLIIHKIDSVTGKGIYGVSFLIYDSSQKPIDQVTTDQNGYIYLDSLDFSGKIFVREMENKGYVADTQLKTFYIKPGETTEITWKNTPIMAQIQIWKKSADDNPINGFPAGTPLEGAVFEIYDKANRLVDTVKSDKNGLAASKLLPLDRYTVKEVKAPPYYSVNNEAVTVYLEHEGQIVQIEVRNTSVFTNVSVHKSGYKEVVPGQSIRYQFSDIANHSTVPLDNFYWRDTLPTDAVRLEKIITGTWTGRLSYKVVYRTNTNSEYRTLADNLNTAKNYTLDASSAALGLASNEYVTEVMFLFGRVPAGFTQLQAPYIYCKVLPGLAHEYRFANKTDVGGLWQGNWVMAVDRWVTIVYNKTTTPTLPRTGY